MTRLTAFLKLIRYPNLLYIFLTQYLLQYAVIRPLLERYSLETTLGDLAFFLLSFSTILIAAAGYIINDYFDINIDLINRPGRVIIDRFVSRRWAMLLHTVFNVTAVIIAFGLAWSIGRPLLGFAQLASAGLLWFYSTSFKRRLLTGNVVISLLTALTVMVVGLYEPALYSGVNPLSAPPAFMLIRIILLYALFAFVVSIVREIVKDLEDIKGDSKEGCRTMPIVYGVNACKDISYVLLWFLAGLILYVQVKVGAWRWYAAVIYLFLLVQLPFIGIMLRLRKAVTPEDFHRAGNWIKLVMLTGILTMVFFKIYW